MDTRSAPFVFLLLTACMTMDGAPSATRGGGFPHRDPAAAAAPIVLPAIPRMRPNVPGKIQTVRAPVRTDAANAAGHAHDADAAGATRPANPADRSDDLGSPAEAAVVAPVAPHPDPDGGSSGDAGLPVTDVETATSAETDVSLGSAGVVAGSEPLPNPAKVLLAGNGLDRGDDGAGLASDSNADLAALVATEEDRGIDVESLFDGDVVRYCAAMWQMGEYIGAARRRGDPFKQAIGDAVQRIANEKQLPLDNRLAFSGQVYGRLVYRLKDSHAARTLGTYVHFACLTVRGDKKIVPADPDAERLLNSGLALCESTAYTREDLNHCIFRELTPIVDRRNG